jgi:flagellin
MVINHNLSAMNANRQLGINNGNQGKSIEKLSSGLKINRAGDDAAGLAISEKNEITNQRIKPRFS